MTIGSHYKMLLVRVIINTCILLTRYWLITCDQPKPLITDWLDTCDQPLPIVSDWLVA